VKTLVIATRNDHKVEEIREVLGDRFRFQTLRDYPNAPNVPEDAPSFSGNATLKAINLARWLAARAPLAGPEDETWVLADDSGLEVDALGGAPGVYSARYAAVDSAAMGNSPDSENNRKLLRLLKGIPEGARTARFRCVIALTPLLARSSGNASPVCLLDDLELQTQLYEGTCEGRIGFETKGTNGFGYDPLFTPAGFPQTFAELGEKTKNQISHRSKALSELVARFPA
jgi:XTP/dITP diphosphohydrolase